MIGGYQLIRRLGSGPRAEVYLGHAGPDSEATGGRNAAIKVFRADVERESIDDEIESLCRLSSAGTAPTRESLTVSSMASSTRHLLALRDIATGADGRPCLIFPRLRPTSLARVLAERELLEPGEAVTILEPLSTAVGHLHSAGVVHGGIRPGAVLFDDDGAPVLACFGSSSRLRIAPIESAESSRSDLVRGIPLPATPAQLAEDPRIGEDLLGLVSIAVSVLARVPAAQTNSAGRELSAWLGSAEPSRLAERLTAELADRLFDFADGLPIELAALDEPSRERAVQSLVFPGFVSPARETPAPEAPARVSRALVPTAPTSEPAARRHLLARTAANARVAMRRVRRPFWVVGALGLAAVVSAVVVFPSTAATEADARAGAATSSPHSSRPTASEGTGIATASADKDSDKATVGDDPVAAAAALLEARERCMTALSVLCLDDVDQEGSAALDGDREVIRSLQEKGTATRERSLADADVQLSQRLGDSALLTISPKTVATEGKSEPTSLLLIKNEAGWRIRDLFRG